MLESADLDLGAGPILSSSSEIMLEAIRLEDLGDGRVVTVSEDG